VLVRRRIQTPSDATVLSVVQPEGEVVLGASPPARHRRWRAGRVQTAGRQSPPASNVGSASAADAARRRLVPGRSGAKGRGQSPSASRSASQAMPQRPAGRELALRLFLPRGAADAARRP
jgi:hypothetical protein